MRIVLDTSVLVSMILGGTVGELIDEWDADNFQVIASAEVVTEYARVLARPKFGLTRDIVEAILGYVQRKIEFVAPTEQIAVIEDDPKDDMFLACAAAVQTDYIVSGDQHLLALGNFRGIPIITPRAFLDLLEKSKRK
ncbi:MAG: putative toxin-antitoxin system toxin component, PIN family [Chloroflexi bacterium]|nr:putative toxin-antitoxin system toxin component, PIN family [Chloroflexota bacterium]